MQILLIESNSLDQAESLVSHLAEQGYIGLAHTPKTAAQQASSIWPDLIILNSADNTLNFADFQQALDETGLEIPRLIVGSKSQLNSNIGKHVIVVALDRDQLDKGIEEVSALQKDRFLRLPDLIIDFHQRQVLYQGESRPLTPKEFKLLHLLIENKNQVLSRKVIMQEVWETDYMGDTRTLDVHIRWIREKIEKNPSRPERLITIRGVGYRFVVKSEAD